MARAVRILEHLGVALNQAKTRIVHIARGFEFLGFKIQLSGSDKASALGIEIQAPSAVLALCRKLVAAGHDPREPLEAYRGNTLALKVRSIGEGARLVINGNGIGFRFEKQDAKRQISI